MVEIGRTVGAGHAPPLLRQATYRFFAGLLLYPERGRVEHLKSAARWLLDHSGRQADPYDLPVGADRVGATLVALDHLNGNLQSLQSNYVRLFQSSPRGFCYPYEGAYTDPEKAAEMSFRLECEYAVAGLKLSVKDFPDHAATELEFMSFLCGHEVEWAAKAAPTRTSAQDGQVPRNVALPGRQGNDRGRGGLARPEGLIEGKDLLHRIRSRQIVFLRDHLSRWFPAFVRRVADSGNGFYTPVCRGAADFIAADKSYLEKLITVM